MIAGSCRSSSRSLDALSACPSRPASSAARMIPRRLVPSWPVPAMCRMNGSETLRPNARQIIASAATPQSAKSIWRTNGNARRRTHGSAAGGLLRRRPRRLPSARRRRAAASAAAAVTPEARRRRRSRAAAPRSRLRCSRARSRSLEANAGSSAPSSPSTARVELEQPAVARGRHRRQARAALERTDLAEHVAGAQEAHVAPGFLLPGVLDQPTRLHDPPARRALAFAHHDVAVAGVDARGPGRRSARRPSASRSPERLVGTQERARSAWRAPALANAAAASGCARARATATPRSSRSTRTALEAARRVTPGGVLLDERPLAARSVPHRARRARPRCGRRLRRSPAPRPRRRRRTRCPRASTRSRRSDRSAPRSRPG